MAQLLPYQRTWVDDESRYKLACKARQIGFTFAATLRAVLRRLKQPGLTVWLSASERQAVEALEQVRRHVTALGVAARFHHEFIAGTDVQQHRISFANGSRILALPANPDTVRGFAGDVVLDEFGFHRDSHAIWRAAFATATRGFQLEVISTPNGAQGKFYELARQAGLVGKAEAKEANEAKEQLVTRGSFASSASVWSPHWCDIHTARALGFDVDIASLRAAVDDEDTWQQEYCCQFLSDAAHYLPLDLVVAAEYASPPLSGATTSPFSAGHRFSERSVDPALFAGSPAESADHPSGRVPAMACPEPSRRAGGGRGPCYVGVDIGRKHDKTVLWLLEEVDGILWTRLVETLDRAPFAQQRAAIEGLLSAHADERPVASDLQPVRQAGWPSRGRFLVQRCAIDASGLGAMLAEELQTRFGARVEPVQFTLAVKEDLAVRLKRLLEERRLRIPYDPAIRRALGAVKRYTTVAGHFRFDAARTEEGHADEFWALALACSAADSAPLSTEFIATQLPSAFRQALAF